MYNAVTRDVERELLPALRRLGMRFYAYNPLAGGLLAGKYTSVNALPTVGRFFEMPTYRDRYWKASYFQAIQRITEHCRQKNVPMVHAAIWWLVQHSDLHAKSSDGIIVGASTPSQLQENLRAWPIKTLTDDLIEQFNKAWELTRPTCQKYFRP